MKRCKLDKIASVTLRLDLDSNAVLGSEIPAEEGTVLACRVLNQKTAYDTLEDVHGRFVKLYPGDVIACALGHRDALYGFSGRVPSKVEVGDRLQLLNMGGVCGEGAVRSPTNGDPFQLEVLGCVLEFPWLDTRVGVPAKVARPALACPDLNAAPGKVLPPIAVLVGTCMDAGKTTAAAALIQELAHRGVRVAAGKLTGVSLRRDVLAMEDCGAEPVAVFTDFGVVTTNDANAVRAAHGLVAHLAAADPDLLVLEMGDGLLGTYGVRALLDDPALRSALRCVMLCAQDPVGAWGGVRLLEGRHGLGVDVVCGRVTDTPVGVRFCREELGLPACNALANAGELAAEVLRSLEGHTAAVGSAGGPGVKPVRLFLYGARGMLGGELARLVEGHPALRLEASVSRGGGASGHRQLAGATALVTPEQALESLAASIRAGERTALALALPHGRAAATWAGIAAELGELAESVAVVDLSADFRLADAELYSRVYGAEHPAPVELARFVYGLPELNRARLRAAFESGPARVAAPGCFATALQLATVPAAAAELVRDDAPWILHGITGSSGSGIDPKAGTHHPHRHGNLWAYGLGGHRHEAELAQALEPLGMAPPVAFVPHSGPFARGIHLTAALPLAAGVDDAAARAVFAEAYAGESFVEVLEEGVPDLRMVVGSNRAALATSVRGELLHVLVTIDNLIKGGSGQALQCLNLALGLDETAGLPRLGLGVA